MDYMVPKEAQKTKLRSENPDPIDIHVGSRLRTRRNLVGMSQDQLAKALELTFQQIQKYERGVNRMGASRLYQVARLLSVPVSYFFEEMTVAQPGFAENGQSELEGAPGGPAEDRDVLQRRETLELVRAYYRIQDPKQRRRVYELIRSMADDKPA